MNRFFRKFLCAGLTAAVSLSSVLGPAGPAFSVNPHAVDNTGIYLTSSVSLNENADEKIYTEKGIYKYAHFEEPEGTVNIYTPKSFAAVAEAAGRSYSSYRASSVRARQVLRLINRIRRRRGLRSLSLTGRLNRAAYRRSKELSSSFSHTRPNGDECFTVFTQYGIDYSYCGENIAAGMKTAKSVVNAWMHSPGHRANILKRQYRHMGIGFVKVNSEYTYYWAQEFTD